MAELDLDYTVDQEILGRQVGKGSLGLVLCLDFSSVLWLDNDEVVTYPR